MEYNLRDAVLCPALHWDTDIVSVGERHAQAVDGGCVRVPITDHIDVCRVGTGRRIPVLSWGWAQAKGSANLDPMICCLIAAVGHRTGLEKI